MSHYIEPKDNNGDPLIERVKVWYVMKLGAVIATSESLDIAQRMVTEFKDGEELLESMSLSFEEKEIDELIFYNDQQRVFVYSEPGERFMIKEGWSIEKPNNLSLGDQHTAKNKATATGKPK
ncbi:hypothetical protein [Pseudomonas sp. SDO5561_S422]